MRIKRLAEPRDLAALYRFRHRVYVEQLGWLASHPTAELIDEFDESAYNYGAFDDSGAVVGSVRVVLDGERGLPLEHCSPLNGYRDDAKLLAEICRLVVSSQYSGSRLGAFLMKAGYERARMLGASHIALDTYVEGDRGTHHLYEALGFSPLTDAYHDPSYRCALPVQTLVMECEQGESRLAENRPVLSRFFVNPDPIIEHG